MKRGTSLYQPTYPFNECPFETICCGSWHGIKSLDIRDGTVTAHFDNQGHEIDEKGPFTNLRIKSRRATLADCTCVLRPGMDVCVFLPHQDTDCSDDEDSEPVWLDAKIRSIERKPHECQCSCQYFVSCYVNQGHLGVERATLSKETEAVGINQISLLQRIEAFPCEDQFYRWDFSEDCPSVQRTKLFLGKFSSDLTWLLVASSLKHASFVVRSEQSKIVYEILDNEHDQSNKHRHALNFKVQNDVLTPVVHQFVLDDTNEVASAGDPHGNELMPLNVDLNLRRSKRRNVQPERFLGCDIDPGTEIGWVRSFPIKYDNFKEHELHLPLSYLFGSKDALSDKHNKEVSLSIMEPSKYCSASKPKLRHAKSTVVHKEEHQTQHSIVPVPKETNSAAFDSYSPVFTPNAYGRETRETVSFGYVHKKNSNAAKWNGNSELEDMVVRHSWKGNFVSKKASVGRHRPVCSNTGDSCEPKIYRKAPLSALAYDKLINSYMKNIDSTIISKEETRVIDQWEQFKAKNLEAEAEKVDPNDIGYDDECSELEMLWREMEICLASVYLMEEDEARVTSQNMQKSSECCQHQFKLDEEIGILCHICGFVKTEIKHVSAPFMEFPEWTADYKAFNEGDTEHMPDEEERLDFFDKPAPVENPPLSEENDNVWALIPELRKKLHVHQKQAFEFLWRNIAGSLEPACMLKASKKIGGCVISHSPGAGKTFLIIAFLASFLKLFPGKRPLVLAPKTTLYTWYKEFIKWEIPLPVHLIHGSGTYRRFRDRRTTFAGGLRPGHDVMHILDCLEKIQKWHAQPSVLVMGYTSFLTFMREDSRFTYRKYMAKILRESPGLLILDEGHNPRSTKSRLRKVLMKVETDLRILLSGTLFQNNFCEYFNTLCLARPKFVKEVLRELDPKFRKRGAEEKSRHLLESRARKFFEDHIARKIDSNEGKQRLKGLNKLKKITSRFIDIYEGGASEGLPGLQIYTILMNLSEAQHNITMRLQKIMDGVAGYPLELELLITLASIHPWLVTTSSCVHKFFNDKELQDFEKYKFDFRKGSKVMFVLNLVYRVIRQEKVLIFCHNIAPINLFIQLFETIFRWQKGKEILVLSGDLELFERGRVIDKFEEPGGPSRVLIASITACAEGISLTAASRVVMLDSEWNPSKTKQAIARAFRRGQQKMVYVYQLLATGTLEEDKYRRTTWKDWVSRMIFSEEYVEDPSRWQAEKIEDEVLREMVAEDKLKSFHMIMKNEKASIDQKNL